MTLPINNQTIVACFFFFCFSAFIAYLFKRSNLFFKMVLFIPFVSLFAFLETSNRLEVSLSAILGVVVVFFDSILNSLYVIKLWLENTFYGISSLIRRILQFIFFPIADLFTWCYNLLSRTCGWNRVFHKLGRPREEQYRKQRTNRPRRNKQGYQTKSESYKKSEPRRDPEQRRESTKQDKPYQDKNRDTKQYKRPEDDRGHRSDKPGQSQSSANGKSYQHSDKKQNSSTQNTTGSKKPNISPEEQARLDAINQAKEELRKAREQAKTKEDQQDDNTGGGGRNYRQILGLGDKYSLADLMKAYKLGVSRYHPDKYSHMSESFQKEAQDEFVKVKKAYNELLKNFN